MAEATYEARMLIDGKLVDGEAGTFTNINPANEDVLGEVADASKSDMNRAIDAARRSFDETDWSTNHQLRKRCLEQLHEAIEGEAGGAARGTHPRGGCPARGDARAAAGRTVGRRSEVPGPTDRNLPVGNRSRRHRRFRHRREHHAKGVARAGRGGRCHQSPWNFPFEVTINKLGQALATGNTVVLKPAPDTPFNATRLGPAHRREDRHPSRCGQRRDRPRTTSSAKSSRSRRRST